MKNNSHPDVVILTPVKDAADLAHGYFQKINELSYPAENLSIALLESDSKDQTYSIFRSQLEIHRQRFKNAKILTREFGFLIPPNTPRWAPEIQLQRRSVLARSRNYLLSRGLGRAEWALWIDSDVIDYPSNLIEQLLSWQKDIIHPHCVKSPGGPSFDTNAWSEHGSRHMDQMRNDSEIVKLDAVGGTVLLVRADLHREGLIFPTFPYGNAHPNVRPTSKHYPPREAGEIETEGFGLMANDMGFFCWGLPNLEVIHRDQ